MGAGVARNKWNVDNRKFDDNPQLLPDIKTSQHPDLRMSDISTIGYLVRLIGLPVITRGLVPDVVRVGVIVNTAISSSKIFALLCRSQVGRAIVRALCPDEIWVSGHSPGPG